MAIRDFLKKLARYLRLVAQSNKTDEANVSLITVVTSIDRELRENLINVEKIDADSVDDCIDESVMDDLNLRKSEMRLSRPSISKPKFWRRCPLQCQRKILHLASRKQLLTTILCAEI
jgi:hypothetical protein